MLPTSRGRAGERGLLPYFGYVRPDRRGRTGEAIGGRAAANVISAAGADCLLVIDPHNTALESMFAIPVETLTAVPILVSALTGVIPDNVVVVAPDLGAVKLAERVAGNLDQPVAFVRKPESAAPPSAPPVW